MGDGMEYVIRILDRKGKLKNGRFIFSLECVLDENKIFKKLLKENNLGQIFLESFLNKTTKSLKQEEFLIKFFSKISQILIDSNILIAFESDYNPDELLRFISNFDKNIGINFDMGNSASNGYDPTTEISALGARIINVHVKDRLLNGTTVPLNEGNCDFIKVFKSLKEINYKNNYILQTARAIDQNHEKVLNDYVNMTLEWLENA